MPHERMTDWRKATADKVRADARRFVDALARRLTELDAMSRKAKRFKVFNAEEYSAFKQLFLSFTERTEEFQLLSYLTEDSLANYERTAGQHWEDHRDLEDHFHQLQVPMLRQVISTNLRLLKIWDDRLQRGEGLPYGARELFLESIRIIHDAKIQLLHPRHIKLLDESALREADRVERLLRTLIRKAPRLFDFAEGGPMLPPGLVPALDDDDDPFAEPPEPPRQPTIEEILHGEDDF